jgi:hypothetical protein
MRVITGLDPVIHLLRSHKAKDVDGRVIKAFTPVFDGAMPGHDDGEASALNSPRHCERSEAIQSGRAAIKGWIASELRSSQ